MRIGIAILAGLAGAAVMSAIMAFVRWLGINISLEELLGSMFQSDSPRRAWQMGFALHLVIGAVMGIVYAVAFEYAVQRSGWLVGSGFGIGHGLMAGLFMSAIPAMTPLIPGSYDAPGPFLSNIHFGALIFLLLHAAYGATVGLIYHPVQRPHLQTKPV
jgi:hypothetical protein